MKLVSRIEIDKPDEVYNLHIQNDHNYLVEGAVVSNCHSIKGDVLFKHLTKTFKDVPIRWGLTGTIPLDPGEATALYASIGPLISEITAKELQDKGLLSKLHIDVLQIQDFYTQFSSYGGELKYLVTDKKRMAFIADKINEIVTSGNTLILVDRIAAGELLQSMIPDSVFIHGDVDTLDRKAEYDMIRSADNKAIIATYGVASTGIDIPRLFNVVMLEAGKSFIKVIQTIGRGIRVAEDKDFVNIYDVCSSAKYSKKHLTERKKFYKSKEYPYKINKISGDFL